MEKLTALVIYEPDIHSTMVLAEKFVPNDPFFDVCIACGSFTGENVDVSSSHEAAACALGDISSAIAQLENIVCRVLYLPGPLDPPELMRRQCSLTPNSVQVHGRTAQLAPGLHVAGYTEMSTTPSSSSSFSSSHSPYSEIAKRQSDFVGSLFNGIKHGFDKLDNRNSNRGEINVNENDRSINDHASAKDLNSHGDVDGPTEVLRDILNSFPDGETTIFAFHHQQRNTLCDFVGVAEGATKVGCNGVLGACKGLGVLILPREIINRYNRLGDEHIEVPDKINGINVVQPMSLKNGGHYAILDLRLNRETGKWHSSVEYHVL